MTGFGKCPRCGFLSMEHLNTHSHCWECSYSPLSSSEVLNWERAEFLGSAPLKQRLREEKRAIFGIDTEDFYFSEA